ncbi:MAG: hypothetical protein CMH56_15775 [Myxococcales bacterium]|nr:hypothetical protein [Myxococcales bacterium]
MDEHQLSLFSGKPTTQMANEGDNASNWASLPFLVVDTETTGLHPHKDQIIELAWVYCRHGHLISKGAHLIEFKGELSNEIKQLTGIQDEMLRHAPAWQEVMPELQALMERSAFMVAYNADFDRRFIEKAFENENKELPTLAWVDPCVFIKEFDKYKKGKKLTDASRRWGVSLNGAHRALADATATAELLLKLRKKIGRKSLEDLMDQQNILKTEQEKSFQAYLAKKNASQESNT